MCLTYQSRINDIQNEHAFFVKEIFRDLKSFDPEEVADWFESIWEDLNEENHSKTIDRLFDKNLPNTPPSNKLRFYLCVQLLESDLNASCRILSLSCQKACDNKDSLPTLTFLRPFQSIMIKEDNIALLKIPLNQKFLSPKELIICSLCATLGSGGV